MGKDVQSSRQPLRSVAPALVGREQSAERTRGAVNIQSVDVMKTSINRCTAEGINHRFKLISNVLGHYLSSLLR